MTPNGGESAGHLGGGRQHGKLPQEQLAHRKPREPYAFPGVDGRNSGLVLLEGFRLPRILRE